MSVPFGLRSIGAVAAVAAAAIAATQMVVGGEDHQAAIEIKIAGDDFRAFCILAVKLHYAIRADAGFVFQVGRHLRQQRFGDFDFGAPAGAFVGGVSAKLAVVRIAAERAVPGIERMCC